MARALVVAVLLAGCGSRPALDYGRALFDDPTVSSAPSNPFRCSTCHEVTATPTKQLPGYVLFDSAARAFWWGGSVQTLLDATNQCVYNFMRGTPLAADDDKGRALFVYLQSLSPDATAPALPLTVVQNIVDVPSGDAASGQQIWNAVVRQLSRCAAHGRTEGCRIRCRSCPMIRSRRTASIRRRARGRW